MDKILICRSKSKFLKNPNAYKPTFFEGVGVVGYLVDGRLVNENGKLGERITTRSGGPGSGRKKGDGGGGGKSPGKVGPKTAAGKSHFRDFKATLSAPDTYEIARMAKEGKYKGTPAQRQKRAEYHYFLKGKRGGWA